MGIRGYILVKLKKNLNKDQLWELTKKHESIDGIEFSTHVIGGFDFVLTVDTKNTFESIIDRIKHLDSSGEIVGLKINNVYDKHREIKDLKILDNLFKTDATNHEH